MKIRRKVSCAIIAIALCFASIASIAEGDLYVTATKLNGRAKPTRKSSVEARFERGDAVTPTGQIHGEWIEVYGGETGTVWCHMDYLSELANLCVYQNTSGGRVKIRKTPNGKHVNWLKNNAVVKIINVIGDWGQIEDVGWVCMQYLSFCYEDK